MKKNVLAQANELAQLLNGIKDVLKAVQDQLTAQDLRITKIEECFSEEVVQKFAAGEQDPAPDQEVSDASS